MKLLCVVLLVCAAAVYAQSPTSGQLPPSGQTETQTQTQGGNNPVNTMNSMNSHVQGNHAQNGNRTQMNNPAPNGNVVNNPTYRGHTVNNAAQSGHMVNNPTYRGHTVNNAAQSGHMVNNPTYRGHTVNNAAQSGHMVNNPSQSGYIMNNPSQNGHMFNTQQRQMQNLLNPGSGFDASRMAGSPLQLQRVRQNMYHHGPKTGHKSTQTGFPAHMLPFFLRSDRGTMIAVMNMMMNNPAMAKFLPIALTGGMSDSLMRTMVLMGMNQGQGQGINPLVAMATMGGAEMSNIAPLLMVSQAGASSAPATGNTGAAAAYPQGGSQTGSSPVFDYMMMSHMM